MGQKVRNIGIKSLKYSQTLYWVWIWIILQRRTSRLVARILPVRQHNVLQTRHQPSNTDDPFLRHNQKDFLCYLGCHPNRHGSPVISDNEKLLSRQTRSLLAQLKAGRFIFHNNTIHLFNCPKRPPIDLLLRPIEVTQFFIAYQMEWKQFFNLALYGRWVKKWTWHAHFSF